MARFGVVRSLLRVLEDGQAAKDVVDVAIDANSAMQNLREAIAGASPFADSYRGVICTYCVVCFFCRVRDVPPPLLFWMQTLMAQLGPMAADTRPFEESSPLPAVRVIRLGSNSRRCWSETSSVKVAWQVRCCDGKWLSCCVLAGYRGRLTHESNEDKRNALLHVRCLPSHA